MTVHQDRRLVVVMTEADTVVAAVVVGIDPSDWCSLVVTAGNQTLQRMEAMRMRRTRTRVGRRTGC